MEGRLVACTTETFKVVFDHRRRNRTKNRDSANENSAEW